MNVIVVGCGRVGAALAESLSGADNRLSVVDADAGAFLRLGNSFQGSKVMGQGYDEEVLREAGIATCDTFVAATNSDNVNLMAVEVARKLYQVPHVIIRLVNPTRLEMYRKLGLDFVCDSELTAEEIYGKIHAQRAYHVDKLGDYETLRFSLVSQGVMHVRDLEDLGDIDVVLFEHDGEVFRGLPNMFLHEGDEVMVAAHVDSLPALLPYMKE